MDNGASSYRRFLDGDETGLSQIIDDYKDGLSLYINSFVNNIVAAEELTEDTFVKLAIKRPHYNKKSSFKTWLYTMGRNTAIDYIRRGERRKEVFSEEIIYCAADMEDLEKAYIKKEQKSRLHRAMSDLKTEYRQILWLVYFDGISIKEASSIIGKSVHATETLAYRARQALKDKLQKEDFI